jgi:hypothetical protein
MNASFLDLTNGQTTQPWLRETVQTFFEGFVWSGAQPHLTTGNPKAGATSESAMVMTVGQFFDAFPWEGQPTIGVPIAPLEAQATIETTNADLTLDDLFG